MNECAGARDVSHGLQNTLGLDEQTFRPGSIPGKGSDFVLSTACIPVLRPTKPPIQWAPGAKQSEREADNPSPRMAGVKMREEILALSGNLSQHHSHVSHTDNCHSTYLL